jgi:hypothetical protein
LNYKRNVTGFLFTLFFAVFFIIQPAYTQTQGEVQDTTSINNDSIPDYVLRTSEEIEQFQSMDSTHSPRLAALYSAVVPGLGQFYNKKYWKIPIIYTLGVFAAFQIKSNHQNYLQFRRVNFILNDANPNNDVSVEDFTARISGVNLERRIENFRRDKEYWIILAGVFYILNIVDATVDAHLREFEINKSLSIGMQPSIQPSLGNGIQTGLSLSLKFK